MAEKGMPEGLRSIMMWVIGVGIIAFILLMLVIIFGNLSGNVGFGQDSSSFVNETINLTSGGNIPAGASGRANGLITNVVMSNATTTGEFINAFNYTITGVVINATAGSEYISKNVNVTYTVSFDEQGKIDTDNIITNYTRSATNTSSQFPVVGTIIGIAVLLLILIGLLIFVITKMMKITESTSSNSSSGGGSFTGSDRSFG